MMDKMRNIKGVSIKLPGKEYTFKGYYTIPGFVLGCVLYILIIPIGLGYKLISDAYWFLRKIF